MLNYHVKVGLVPIRRDVTPRPGIFNWEKAEERCAAAVAYIEEHFTSENVSFVDLKGINAVDVLYSDKDVDAVIDRFRAEKVDAVFLINGNFGNEEVAGAVAKAIGKQLEQAKTNDDKSAAGLQFLGALLENATDPKAEELIWNFLAGPFEKKNGAAAKAMEINELADAVGELMKENDLAGFFGKVRRLIPMK